MQTECIILSIANRIQDIKHYTQNTLYYALQTEYTILSIANRMHYIKHCKQQTEYTILSIANRIQIKQNTLY